MLHFHCGSQNLWLLHTKKDCTLETLVSAGKSKIVKNKTFLRKK